MPFGVVPWVYPGSHDRSLWGELLRPTAKYPVLLQEKRDGVVHLWVANQVLVSLNKGVFPKVLEQAFIDDPVFALRWLNDTSAVVSWDLTEAEEFSITMAAIEGKLGVLATVEPDSIWTVSAMPTDPLLWQQDYFARVGAQEGWAKRAHASGIVIALLDTGIQLDHPDLASAVAVNTAEVPNTGRDDDGNGKVDDVLGWDFVQNNNWPNDLNGHGTNMAGVIAAAWNDVGIAGIANGALIVPIRFMDADGFGASSDLIEAIDDRIHLSVPMPTDIRLGEYQLSLRLDPGNRFEEFDKDNNYTLSAPFIYHRDVPVVLEAVGLFP